MNEKNHVELHGTVRTDPVFAHRTGEIEFMRFELAVPRMSGAEDVLPVLVRKDMDAGQISAGKEITVDGSLRSWTNKSGTGRKLVLDVFAEDWVNEPGGALNQVVLSGRLVRSPVLRRTPFGRAICDCFLGVERMAGSHLDYIPMIAWGSVAYAFGDLDAGDSLSVEGRFQSRVYHKILDGGATEDRTAYEVSVHRSLV